MENELPAQNIVFDRRLLLVALLLLYADVVGQKLYNYWDRIGDLIAAYFPDLLEPHQIFVPKIIEAIPLKDVPCVGI